MEEEVHIEVRRQGMLFLTIFTIGLIYLIFLLPLFPLLGVVELAIWTSLVGGALVGGAIGTLTRLNYLREAQNELMGKPPTRQLPDGEDDLH